MGNAVGFPANSTAGVEESNDEEVVRIVTYYKV